MKPEGCLRHYPSYGGMKMPRPKKCRKVCCLPKYDEFGPKREREDDTEPIVLTVDEYETVRLIDNEGVSQEECSAYMRIARTTVQQIYTVARKKLADALVNGRPLIIRGGHYRLCDGKEAYCECSGCHGHGRRIVGQRGEDEEK